MCRGRTKRGFKSLSLVQRRCSTSYKAQSNPSTRGYLALSNVIFPHTQQSAWVSSTLAMPVRDRGGHLEAGSFASGEAQGVACAPEDSLLPGFPRPVLTSLTPLLVSSGGTSLTDHFDPNL